ncbi:MULTISPECIES: type VI secretion system baseplate subunit TssG [Tenebrionibacter/Tenebrionicola group]|uniref:Type VI secretion system baseplate subunit TssG n=2 Tax=Tenebrionibacter/Tenebrionicola group TaxID=2969848 RepID=A0A8K0V9V7_9ENTR|nr:MULTISPECIES: type VI secretion system baseplate subunit TssG [Tenebrionibacter/Tenebrionicola group]MBK4716982.1 type VI secretion system baseplate subunit TssG [Tenebrionibacter intestinalis]MBV5097520.1 type VI secretion system baseplate subunit TssG [Tenebrionicola larvae]
MTNNLKKQTDSALPPFWLDSSGRDRTAEYNFYRFCRTLETLSGTKLGTGASLADPVRFRPDPHMGFPAGELRRTETDPNNPQAPPTVRTTFLGLYGVDSPLPTDIVDAINQGADGAEAMAAFLDIFNHRIMTQFYRIWRKYSYPATFEAGGTDSISSSLMALMGIMPGRHQPAPRLLGLLQPLLMTTHTVDGIKAVIRNCAPGTRVCVVANQPVNFPTRLRARLSAASPMRLQKGVVMGSNVSDANYCMTVELETDDPDEVTGWLPGGLLREEVFLLLKTYLGHDYDMRFWLTLPVNLLPRPRLGDRRLLNGYNIMLRQREDDRGDRPQAVRIGLGRLRGAEGNRN